MLAIRLQRTGRKGSPAYRVVVQDSRKHPSSGKIAASIGSYNPHDKTSSIDADKAEFYLKNGAQPTTRVVNLLKEHKVSLPAWVEAHDAKKNAAIRNPEKLRRNRPAEEAADPVEAAEAPAEAEESTAETDKPEQAGDQSESATEAAKDETPAESKE